MAVSFIGGGNRSIRRKTQNCHYHYINKRTVLDKIQLNSKWIKSIADGITSYLSTSKYTLHILEKHQIIL